VSSTWYRFSLPREQSSKLKVDSHLKTTPVPLMYTLRKLNTVLCCSAACPVARGVTRAELHLLHVPRRVR